MKMTKSARAPAIQRAVSYDNSDNEEDKSLGKIVVSKTYLANLQSDSKKYNEAKTLIHTLALSEGCPVNGKLLVDPLLLVEHGILDPNLANLLVQWKWKLDTRNSAEAGDTSAMLVIGKAYEYGESGFPQDDGLAFDWYQRAANLGNAEGMAEAGACLIWAVGVQFNVSLGIDMLETASKKGSAYACRCLGDYFAQDIFEADEMLVSKRTAMAWYGKALQLSLLKDATHPFDDIDRNYVREDLWKVMRDIQTIEQQLKEDESEDLFIMEL